MPPHALAVLPLVNRHHEAPGRDRSRQRRRHGRGDRPGDCALRSAAKRRAVVTGPIDKKALYDAGFRHPGHTEYLADLCGTHLGTTFTPVMLLTGPELSCVPVTIHIPIAEVPERLTTDLIETTCRIVAADYRTRLGVSAPRLAISGLNPHAGEKGAIGLEDEAVIRPAIAAAAGRGHRRVRPAAGRHDVSSRSPRPLRRRRLHVPRSGADPGEDARLRPDGERDARPADHAHLARPRHGRRHRRNRQGAARQLPGRPPPRRPDGARVARKPGARRDAPAAA